MSNKLVICIEGGVLQGVYSDWLNSMETKVILIDQDNIEQGDPNPLPEFDPTNYNQLY